MRTPQLTKGDLMKLVYSEAELRNIDSAIPIELWQNHNTLYHVNNYNGSGCFGRIENIFEIAKQRNIDVSKYEHWHHRTCVLCNFEYEGFGNNAEPLHKGKCCDKCNAKKVIPARLKALKL